MIIVVVAATALVASGFTSLITSCFTWIITHFCFKKRRKKKREKEMKTKNISCKTGLKKTVEPAEYATKPSDS